MKKSKKSKQENTAPELDPIEAHVKEIMEGLPEEEQTSTPAESATPNDSDVGTAPELPKGTAKSGKNEAADKTDSVQEAIEEANRQLQEAPETKPNDTPSAKEKTEAATEPAETSSDQPPPRQELETTEVINSLETEKAVDEIVAEESDELLAVEDAINAEDAEVVTPKPKTARRGLKQRLSDWWHNKKARRITFAALGFGVMVLFAVPLSRYAILNAVGVRSSASLRIIDQSTQQPLRNVSVSLAGQSVQTNGNGEAVLQNLRLGSTELRVQRRAFAEFTRNVTLGWGSNPLGEFALQPVGTQYTFKITDFVSGEPLAKIEAIYDDISAFSDEEGILKLTLDDVEADQIDVKLVGEGYREETVSINTNDREEKPVAMVAARQHAFVSKRSGTFDLYKIDVDGKNEELVQAGTGSERDDMVLVPHPTENKVAYVSTRGNKRNDDGFLLSTLQIIDLETNQATEITASERVQIVGWGDDRIVYVQIADGESGVSPKRHRLMSSHISRDDTKELAAANYFNDVIMIGKTAYYAPSSVNSSGINASLFAVNADASNKRVILDKEAWSLVRNAHDRLLIAFQQEWYEYRPGSTGTATKLEGEPENLKSRVYTDNPGQTHSLWVDLRDGKGVLLDYDLEKKEENALVTMSGLKNPVYWLNDHTAVFRVNAANETADYVVSVRGGEAKKISDVTDTGGVDRWYYY